MGKVKNKLKQGSLKYFLVPFICLLIIFGVLTFLVVQDRVREQYGEYEATAVNLVESYTKIFEVSYDATEIISDMLDEKLRIASQAILIIEKDMDNRQIEDLSVRFGVDEIFVYNKEGEIVKSTVDEYIGWKAYKGHPVYDFMLSKDSLYIEDIRQDSESGVYFKYAYFQNPDGTFTQIGILAEKIQQLYQTFEYQSMVDSLKSNQSISNSAFVDNNYTIIASTVPEYRGDVIDDLEVRTQIDGDTFQIALREFSGERYFFSSMPEIHNNQRHGTLIITWKTDQVYAVIKKIIINAIMQLLVILAFLGGIMYFAYRKNKANIALAFYDHETNLPNTSYLVDVLEDSILNSSDSTDFILITIRNHNTLQMSYGSAFAGQLMAVVAGKIGSLLEQQDRVFVYDVDSLAVVRSRKQDDQDVLLLSRKILGIFKSPIEVSGDLVYAHVEIGAVQDIDKDTPVEVVLQHALLARSRASKNPNLPIGLFQGDMERLLQRQAQIEKLLRSVIAGTVDDAFSLHFQPKLNLKTQEIEGFEALARLRHPELGAISPIEFIEIAESQLLIYDLGKLVIQKACEMLLMLQQEYHEMVSIAVNISVGQLLRDEFIEDIQQIVTEHGIEPKFLELEVTESVLLVNFELVNIKLEELKKLGFSISLDDFGTGYSSFSRLGELHIDAVKIDRSFIMKIEKPDDAKSIVKDIISMSDRLGLRVVSEGVEDEVQYQYVLHHGCDVLQGYYLSKPLPQEKALEFLHSRIS